MNFTLGPLQIAGIVALVILIGLYVAEAIMKRRQQKK